MEKREIFLQKYWKYFPYSSFIVTDRRYAIFEIQKLFNSLSDILIKIVHSHLLPLTKYVEFLKESYLRILLVSWCFLSPSSEKLNQSHQATDGFID